MKSYKKAIAVLSFITILSGCSSPIEPPPPCDTQSNTNLSLSFGYASISTVPCDSRKPINI